jgi:hypothetical protein
VPKRIFHLKREVVCAFVLVATVFLGTFFHLPPFASVIQLNSSIKEYWESRSEQAPYPHAEASTLSDFSNMTGVSLDLLVESLGRAGIEVNNPTSQTIEDLARIHNLSPKDLFVKISVAGGPTGRGTGIGKQTLESLCLSTNVVLETAIEGLKKQGFEAKKGTTLKSLGEQKGISPAEVRGLIIELSNQ